FQAVRPRVERGNIHQENNPHTHIHWFVFSNFYDEIEKLLRLFQTVLICEDLSKISQDRSPPRRGTVCRAAVLPRFAIVPFSFGVIAFLKCLLSGIGCLKIVIRGLGCSVQWAGQEKNESW